MYAASVARRSVVSPDASKIRMARSFISVAAFRVKVSARMRSGPTSGSRAIATKRSTSTVVLPAPAPAVTARSQLRSADARRRSPLGSVLAMRRSHAEGADAAHGAQLAVAAVVVPRPHRELAARDANDLGAQ